MSWLRHGLGSWLVVTLVASLLLGPVALFVFGFVIPLLLIALSTGSLMVRAVHGIRRRLAYQSAWKRSSPRN